MSDWEQRLRDVITLTSPNKNVFNPLWTGDDREIEKQVGVFSYPNFNKSVTQDQGAKGTSFPLTLYFVGENTDKESQRFERTLLNERGPWTVVHPTRGKVTLQPISASIKDQPVTSGGVTRVVSKWIESVDIFALASVAEVRQLSLAASIVAKAAAAEDLIANTSQATQAGIRAVSNQATAILGVITGPLSILASASGEILEALEFSISNLETQLAAPELDLQQISANIQSIMELPQTVSTDYESRNDTYDTVINNIVELLPPGTTDNDKNKILITETFLNSGVSSVAQIATSSEYRTRAQAIFAAENLTDQYKFITNELGKIQDNFKTRPIKDRYISQAQTFATNSKMVFQSVSFAFNASFNLPTEKRFIVKNDISSIALFIQQGDYKDFVDSDYQDFVELNALSGSEISLVPAGREMVYYGG